VGRLRTIKVPCSYSALGESERLCREIRAYCSGEVSELHDLLR